MGENVLTGPVMATEGRRFRLRGWMVVAVTLGVLLVVVALGTWSVSSGYGGVDADGNWTDADGVVVATAPVMVDVVAHASPLAVTVILLVGLLGVVVPPTLARWGRARAGEVVRVVAVVALPVLAVVAVLVFTVWQSSAVTDQVQHQVLPVHGFPFGGTTITTGHETR